MASPLPVRSLQDHGSCIPRDWGAVGNHKAQDSLPWVTVVPQDEAYGAMPAQTARREEKVAQWWAGWLGRQMATFLTKGRVRAFDIFNVSDQFISRLHKAQLLRGVAKHSEEK